MKKPSFFIVGAPKSGTTSLYESLNQHPEIFMPKQKELNYFCDDLEFINSSGLYDYNSLNDYLAHFEGADEAQICGDASVWYLMSENAARNIHDFNKDSKVIIVLREPVDLLYSLYYQFLETGDENILDFKNALDSSTSREKFELIPPNDQMSAPIQALNYWSVVRFEEQVRRFLEIFGWNNVLVIDSNQLKTNTSNVINDIFSFLGVSENFQPEIVMHNKNKVIRSKFVWGVVNFSPIILKKVWRLLLPPFLRERILFFVYRVNFSEKERPEMDDTVKLYVKERTRMDFSTVDVRLNEKFGSWNK